MAVDMGINRSFVTLLRSGMGKHKGPEELEEERHLVVQSRVWFCVGYSLLRATSEGIELTISCIWLSIKWRMVWAGLPSCARMKQFINADDSLNTRCRSCRTRDWFQQ